MSVCAPFVLGVGLVGMHCTYSASLCLHVPQRLWDLTSSTWKASRLEGDVLIIRAIVDRQAPTIPCALWSHQQQWCAPPSGG